MSTDSATIEQVSELLQNATPADFDGHTEFHRMAPEERLMWLSQGAQFIVEARMASRERVLADDDKNPA